MAQNITNALLGVLALLSLSFNYKWIFLIKSFILEYKQHIEMKKKRLSKINDRKFEKIKIYNFWNSTSKFHGDQWMIPYKIIGVHICIYVKVNGYWLDLSSK